jgi:hypothetical protein
MQMALALAQAVERQATNQGLKELAASIQLVLGAPAELLSRDRLNRIETLLHENSGSCCFNQRGYNWKFEQGVWSVRACTVCKRFTNWADALQAAMSDQEFRQLKPVAIAPNIGVPSAPVPYFTFPAFQATRKQLDRLDAQTRIRYEADFPVIFLYADRFAIEYDPQLPVAYYLIAERSEYRSTDLAELELKLYEYAIESEEITGPGFQIEISEDGIAWRDLGEGPWKTGEDARDYVAAEVNPRLRTRVIPSTTA